MPAQRKKAKTLEPNEIPNPEFEKTPKISLYEQSREERIRENLQRLQRLGIFDLSLKLKSQSRSTKRGFSNTHSGRKPSRDTPPAPPSGSLRRSSRLQNATPVSYSEVVVAKKERHFKEKVELEEGSRPEIYTEEHEKLLGNTERSWTFFVDGYAKDGKRIYDPVRGKTCHQCRQKTLGYRTHCSQCNMVQGQFCGDCLYMRYGEHVLEALENENWICPVCRGICNCSLCRTAKGWLPTGPIYRRISKLGYKSVAHYLIQAKRSEARSEKEFDSTNQTSAKRTLAFSDTKALSEEPPKATDDLSGTPEFQHKDNEDGDGGGGCQRENGQKMEKTLNSTRRSLPFSHSENNNEVAGVQEMNPGNIAESGICEEGRRKRKQSIQPNPDSIAARLRQRRRNCDDHDNQKLQSENEKAGISIPFAGCSEEK